MKTKHFLITLGILVPFFTFGQTNLTTGDISIVTLNTQGYSYFEVVTLVDLAEGTVLHFTDDGWIKDEQKFKGKEGIITYTVPTGGLKAGTPIQLTDYKTLPTNNFTKKGSFNLTKGGDNFFIYQGTETTPKFLLGVAIDGNFSTIWQKKDGSKYSEIPDKLNPKEGTVFALGTKANYQYDISKGTEGTKDELFELLCNPQHFAANDDNAFSYIKKRFTVKKEGIPKAKNLEVLSATELRLYFSQKMDEKGLEKVENYYFSNAEQKVQTAKAENAKTVFLTTTQRPTGKYELHLQNLKNKQGVAMPETVLVFEYFAPAKPNDVVINELLLDEKPSIELPEYEYIELYNTTNSPIILTDWVLTVGKREKNLPTDTLKSDEYVLLCDISAVKSFEKYGNVIGIPKFPTLANTEGKISLKNTENVVIDEVAYKKTWYNDKEKDEGGWSLERIDPKAPSNSRANWAASTDERGGTPCEKNSVFGIVLDETPPKVQSAIPITRKDFQLTFNEEIDTLALEKKLFFVNGIGYPQKLKIHKNATQILLSFQEEFAYGQTYELGIKEIVDWFGNALENVIITFGFPELVKHNELVINEILFNPALGAVDYVELYNRSKKIFDLSTIFIATRDAKQKLKSVYVASKESHLLLPNEFVVLTTEPGAVAQEYTVKNADAMLKMPKLPSFPNTQGVVVILNQESEVVDELHYDEKMHLPMLISTKGVALERMNYDIPTQNPSNWHSASEASGYGTPSYQNSTFSEPQNTETHIHISPKVFSPNGDGIDDFMQLHYKFDQPNKIARISIFDSNGRLVRNLHSNLTLDTQGIITWDGVNSSNERVRTGRYIIYIEIFDTEGNTEIFKRSCVIHGRFL